MFPPPIPKRRYCSVGVGDNNPIESIVCYSREKATKNVSSSCNLPIPSSHSFEFSHQKNGNFSALPPPPENSQTSLFNVHSSSQTCLSLLTFATQTKRSKHREKGCGDGRIKQVIDSYNNVLYFVVDNVCNYVRYFYRPSTNICILIILAMAFHWRNHNKI